MARIRTIKPEFWEDEKLAKLPVHARLLFIGTWNFADDNGALLANPVLMKSHIFPYEDIGISTISEWIDILVENGMLIRTTYNGKDYLVIRKFLIHQKINRKSIRINIPLPVVHKVIGEHYTLAEFTAKHMPRNKRSVSGLCQGPKYFSFNGISLYKLKESFLKKS